MQRSSGWEPRGRPAAWSEPVLGPRATGVCTGVCDDDIAACFCNGTYAQSGLPRTEPPPRSAQLPTVLHLGHLYSARELLACPDAAVQRATCPRWTSDSAVFSFIAVSSICACHEQISCQQCCCSGLLFQYHALLTTQDLSEAHLLSAPFRRTCVSLEQIPGMHSLAPDAGTRHR